MIAFEIASSFPNMDQRQLRPCESAYLGLHQVTPPNKFRLFEAGRGLKACHAFKPRGHGGENQYVSLYKTSKAGVQVKPMKPSSRRVFPY